MCTGAVNRVVLRVKLLTDKFPKHHDIGHSRQSENLDLVYLILVIRYWDMAGSLGNSSVQEVNNSIENVGRADGS